MLDELELELVGFELDWATLEAYRMRFGDDPRAVTNSSAETPMSRAIFLNNSGEISRPL